MRMALRIPLPNLERSGDLAIEASSRKLVKIGHFRKTVRRYSVPKLMTTFPPLLRWILPLVCLILWAPAGAQTAHRAAPQSGLGGDEVVNKLIQRNLERAQSLHAYEGLRTYRLDYRGFPSARTAEMVVEMKYESPRTKVFTVRSESGSKLVIDRVFKKLMASEQEALNEENQNQIALNRNNYNFALVGNESASGGLLYVLLVEPRIKNKLLFRGKIWVDGNDFAVVRMEGEPAKNPSFWIKETKIEQLYARVGDFWLPVSNRSTSVIRLGGRASLTIDYRDYRITSAAAPGSKNSVAGNR
jgi:hypothetical protein